MSPLLKHTVPYITTLYLSIYLSIYLYIYIYVNLQSFVGSWCFLSSLICTQSVGLLGQLIHPSIYLSIHLSIIYLSMYLSMTLQSFVGPWRFFSLFIYTQSVGLLGRGISPSQGRYLHTEQHKTE
jgi:hypothetical protein